MHVVSRLSRNRSGGGAVRSDMALDLSREQGEAGCLRPRRKTWRVRQEAASHVPGHHEIRLGLGGRVDRAAGRLAEFQSVQRPLPKALRVTFVSGGDEHYLRSAFHDLASLELRISFTPS